MWRLKRHEARQIEGGSVLIDLPDRGAVLVPCREKFSDFLFPVLPGNYFPVKFRIFRFQNSKIQKNSYKTKTGFSDRILLLSGRISVLSGRKTLF